MRLIAFLVTTLAPLLLGQVRLAPLVTRMVPPICSRRCKKESRLPNFHVVLGQIYLRRRQLKEAEEAFRKALEIDEDSAEAHDGLGVVLREQGLLEDALYEHAFFVAPA